MKNINKSLSPHLVAVFLLKELVCISTFFLSKESLCYSRPQWSLNTQESVAQTSVVAESLNICCFFNLIIISKT